MQPPLAPEEWALLGLIYRHTHDGKPAPSATNSFASAYEALSARGLIEYSRDRNIWIITAPGDCLLREHMK